MCRSLLQEEHTLFYRMVYNTQKWELYVWHCIFPEVQYFCTKNPEYYFCTPCTVNSALLVVVWWFEMCWTMLPTAALCCRRPTKDAHLSRIEAASSSSSSGNHGDDDFWEWWWYNDHDVVTCVHAHVYQSTSSSSTSFLSCALLPPLNFKRWEPCLLSPLCFVVFPPFSLSQLFSICRFHFLNTSFLLTLRVKHPCCICFHLLLWFSLTPFAMWSLSLFLFLNSLPSVVSS